MRRGMARAMYKGWCPSIRCRPGRCGLRWILRPSTARHRGDLRPLLVRELARLTCVHVFSASYASFLLAPLPAMLARAGARQAGHPELPQRPGAGPPRAARVSRAAPIARASGTSSRRGSSPASSAAMASTPTIIPNLVDLDRFAFREREPFVPRLVSTRNFDDLYNVGCTVRAFRLVQDRWPEAALTLVGGGPQEGALRGLAASPRAAPRAVRRTRTPRRDRRHYPRARHLHADARTSTTCRRP